MSCFSFSAYYLLLIKAFSANEDTIQARLERIREDGKTEEETIFNKPFSERVLRPVMESVGKSLLKLAPAEWINSMETKIIMAGKPKNRGVKDWITLQAICILIIPGGLLFLLTQLHVPIKNILLIVIAITRSYLIPQYGVNSKFAHGRRRY